MTSTVLSGRGMCFDLAFEEFDVFDAGLALVFAGEGEHLVGHVEAVGFAGGADAAGGEEDVDAAAASRGRGRFRRA